MIFTCYVLGRLTHRNEQKAFSRSFRGDDVISFEVWIKQINRCELHSDNEAHCWLCVLWERLTLSLQVSSPRLRWSGTCDREVRIPQKRVRMPHSSQEAKGRLPEWHPVHVEVWQDRGHVLPHTGLWRLRSRQRQLPDTSQVGLRSLSACCCCCWLKGELQCRVDLSTQQKLCFHPFLVWILMF